ncbi:hypothetical protein MPTK1_7g03920 [Marchantia polymorpha subsp. ruderalis]|uniref:Uncharacterized protein n=2 Tax=Marchantia polymorpha TaxID=3197 RepID=A0AAF6BVX4_MARPO|nr:hypothetical protein MARPO_0074s0007 [Marchantia polymorpha]BBN16158.1 hypothetical protein Mp_7g03920 [Marchantia polymorpha subsp. ruderalis]|eukprot:PTQ35009.1 hypothetical protein MARPO_0074s0007 [Marchantia polymorpha]
MQLGGGVLWHGPHRHGLFFTVGRFYFSVTFSEPDGASCHSRKLSTRSYSHSKSRGVVEHLLVHPLLAFLPKPGSPGDQQSEHCPSDFRFESAPHQRYDRASALLPTSSKASLLVRNL